MTRDILIRTRTHTRRLYCRRGAKRRFSSDRAAGAAISEGDREGLCPVRESPQSCRDHGASLNLLAAYSAATVTAAAAVIAAAPAGDNAAFAVRSSGRVYARALAMARTRARFNRIRADDGHITHIRGSKARTWHDFETATIAAPVAAPAAAFATAADVGIPVAVAVAAAIAAGARIKPAAQKLRPLRVIHLRQQRE